MVREGTEGKPAPNAMRPGPRLLDRVRAAVRARHYSRRTETAYVRWIRKQAPEAVGACFQRNRMFVNVQTQRRSLGAIR
jgi:hypothetical protein